MANPVLLARVCGNMCTKLRLIGLLKNIRLQDLGYVDEQCQFRRTCAPKLTSLRAYCSQNDSNNEHLNATERQAREIQAGKTDDGVLLKYNEDEQEDTSDPCADLDFNGDGYENISQKEEFTWENGSEERLPLPSEPLDKG